MEIRYGFWLRSPHSVIACLLRTVLYGTSRKIKTPIGVYIVREYCRCLHCFRWLSCVADAVPTFFSHPSHHGLRGHSQRLDYSCRFITRHNRYRIGEAKSGLEINSKQTNISMGADLLARNRSVGHRMVTFDKCSCSKRRAIAVTVRILIVRLAELRLCGLVVTCHGEA